MADIDSVAMRAMDAAEDPTPAAVEAPAPASAATTPAAGGGKSIGMSLPSVSTMRSVIGNGVFRVLVVFAVVAVMLVAINPPFVQARGKRNSVEAAPCSYGRVLVAAAVGAVLAGLVPLGVQNHAAITDNFGKFRDWVKRVTAKEAAAEK